MNEDIKNKLKEYISKYRNYALALNGWVKLKNKNFQKINHIKEISCNHCISKNKIKV